MSSVPQIIERPIGNYYGIQLNNQPRKEITGSIDHSTITFHWETILENINLPQSDIIIQVAQHLRDANTHQVKELAMSIEQTKKITPLDRIFGLEGQRIDRIGFVTKKEIRSQATVAITIEWITETPIKEVSVPVFRADKDIQQLKGRDLNQIEKYYGSSIQEVYNFLPVLEDNRRLSYAEKMIDTFWAEEVSPKEDSGGTISLFYGTNRNPTIIENAKQQYGSKEGNLHLGKCVVSIPQGHVQGKLERPPSFLGISLRPELEGSDVVVKTVEGLGNDAFLGFLNAKLEEHPQKNALLFVHGYNNSFEEAARRTGQLAWDLQFKGAAGFFSWPSGGKWSRYFTDEATARSSSKALEEFLTMILVDTNIEYLHIIAHSMGNLVMTLSLSALQRTASETHLSKIRQLILGAPDIDQDEFRNVILPEFKKIGQRRTIYASDHDFPLSLSSIARSKRLRLGQIGTDLFLDKDMDTVEASNIKDTDSHGYIFESRDLLNDIFLLVTQSLGPENRRLQKRDRNTFPYWLFMQ